MKAIQIDQPCNDLETAIKSLCVVEKPIPTPRSGQVLIKMEAAPCNPSDLLFLQGAYAVKKTFPAVPGWEGAGTVVESGGGPLGWWLKGKRVACGGQSQSDGTWAEYYVVDVKSCIPLKSGIQFDQGATLIINPLTAYGMVDKAAREGHRGIIQTAACSQVGKMVQVLAGKKLLPVINIVRREEQVNELKNLGEKYVLNSESSSFPKQLKELAQRLRASIAFDAVGGTMTGDLFNAMPRKGKVLVYGGLSGQPCTNISPLNLIFEKKRLEGFWLTEWIHSRGFLGVFQASRQLQKYMKEGSLSTKIHSKVSFDGWKDALLDYTQKMTDGKAILHPFS